MKRLLFSAVVCTLLFGLVSATHTAIVTVNETGWISGNGTRYLNFTFTHGGGANDITTINLWQDDQPGGDDQFDIASDVLELNGAVSSDWATDLIDFDNGTGALDGDLDRVLAYENNGGASYLQPGPPAAFLSLILGLDPLNEGNYTWHWNTTDTDTPPYNFTGSLSVALDMSAPTSSNEAWNVSGTLNPTTGGDTFATATTDWNDAGIGLDHCWLETNETGSWANHSYEAECDGTVDYERESGVEYLDFSVYPDTTICFRSHANDTGGFTASTAQYCVNVGNFTTQVYDEGGQTPSEFGGDQTIYAKWQYTNLTDITTADKAVFEFDGTNYSASYDGGSSRWEVYMDSETTLSVGTYYWTPYFEKVDHTAGIGAQQTFVVNPVSTQVTGEGSNAPREYSDPQVFWAVYEYTNGTDIDAVDAAWFEISGTNYSASWIPGSNRWEVTAPAGNLSVGNYTWTPYFELSNHETGVGGTNDHDIAPTSTQVSQVNADAPTEFSDNQFLCANYNYTTNGTAISVADVANFEINGQNYTGNWADGPDNWCASVPPETVPVGNYTWTVYFELANHELQISSGHDLDVARTSTQLADVDNDYPVEYSDGIGFWANYQYTNGTDITEVDTANFEINGQNYSAVWDSGDSEWYYELDPEEIAVGNYTWKAYFIKSGYELRETGDIPFHIARTSTQLAGIGSTTPDEYSDSHTLWANYQYTNGTDITQADTVMFEVDGAQNNSGSWSGSRWEYTASAASIPVGNYTWKVYFIKANYEIEESGDQDFDVAPTSTQLTLGSSTPDEHGESHTLYANYQYLNGTDITVAETAEFEFDGGNITASWDAGDSRWEVEIPAASLPVGSYNWEAYFELSDHQTQLSAPATLVVNPTSTQVSGEGSSSPDVFEDDHLLYAVYEYTNGTDITTADTAEFEFGGTNYSAAWDAGDSRWEVTLPGSNVPRGSYTWTPYFELSNHATGIGGSNNFEIALSHTTNASVNETDWLTSSGAVQVNFTIWNEAGKVNAIGALSLYPTNIAGADQFDVTAATLCNSTGLCTPTLGWTTTLTDRDTDSANDEVNFSTTTVPLALGDYVTVTLTLTPVGEGNYTWVVDTTDTSGERYQSLVYIALDNRGPSYQLASLMPANGTTTDEDDYLSAYGGNVSAYIEDSGAGLDTVKLWHNASGSWVAHDYTGTAGGYFNYTFASDLDAAERVNWFFWANDSAGNENTTEQRYFVVLNRAPDASGVTAVSPANGATTNDNTPSLDWTDASDADNDALTYDLRLENSSNWFDYYAIGSSNYDVLDVLSDGVWTWNVTAVDSHTGDANQNSSSSSEFTFVLDATAPQWQAQLPSNGTSVAPCGTSQTVSAVWVDTLSGVDTVKLWHNSSGVWTSVTPTNSSNNYTHTLTGLSSGSEVGWYLWANDSAGNENTTDMGVFLVPAAYIGANTYQTVQAALDAAGDGDTVYVCPGTHAESLTWHSPNTKLQSVSGPSVTILDTSSGAISFPGPNGVSVSGGTLSGFTVTSNQNVLVSIASNVDRITVENCVFYQTAAAGAVIDAYNSDDFLAQNNKFYYKDMAIDFNPGTGAAVSNNIYVTSNEFHADDTTSNALVLGAFEGVRITQNTFNKTEVKVSLVAADSNNITISNNEFFHTAGAFTVEDASAGAGDQLSNLTVRYNEFTNNTRGVYFNANLEADDVDLSSVNVTFNNFVNSSSGGAGTDMGVYSALTSAYLNASYNYWGNATGPTHASNTGGSGTEISDYVRFDPYALGPGRATMNSSGQTVVEGEYNVTDTTELVIANAAAAASISVPSNVTNATVNLEGIADYDADTGEFNATLEGGMNLSVETSLGTVDVKIPAGTKVSGTTTTGIAMNVPQVRSNSGVSATPDSGKTSSVQSVIEIGLGDTPLTFDKAVRILIPGQAGKYVGYSRGSVFTKITTECTADTQAAGDALPDGGDCKISVGSDMVVWTKHFTQFVTYTQTDVPAEEEEEESSRSGGATSDVDWLNPQQYKNFVVDGEDHKLKLEKIEDGVAYIILQSTTASYTLSKGESIKHDFDGDDRYDVKITASNVLSYAAAFLIEEIDERMSASAIPAEPAPSEPAPSEPAPSEPAPVEPAPSEPAPSEPAPSEPAPVEPAPSEPEVEAAGISSSMLAIAAIIVLAVVAFFVLRK